MRPKSTNYGNTKFNPMKSEEKELNVLNPFKDARLMICYLYTACNLAIVVWVVLSS